MTFPSIFLNSESRPLQGLYWRTRKARLETYLAKDSINLIRFNNSKTSSAELEARSDETPSLFESQGVLSDFTQNPTPEALGPLARIEVGSDVPQGKWKECPPLENNGWASEGETANFPASSGDSPLDKTKEEEKTSSGIPCPRQSAFPQDKPTAGDGDDEDEEGRDDCGNSVGDVESPSISSTEVQVGSIKKDLDTEVLLLSGPMDRQTSTRRMMKVNLTAGYVVECQRNYHPRAYSRQPGGDGNEDSEGVNNDHNNAISLVFHTIATVMPPSQSESSSSTAWDYAKEINESMEDLIELCKGSR
ncbi:hypothetical protein B0T22DRAFT_436782 [Podospora appendiculata]|uniref:Uncharacterized protein n=1 Tax=Podospora appendiculata TaxID=314037 RepID=A0AAE0XHT5_9PEZI|nr:hypothetical protein B0T22DRAFT_436782 [Podospora appendiculata]